MTFLAESSDDSGQTPVHYHSCTKVFLNAQWLLLGISFSSSDAKYLLASFQKNKQVLLNVYMYVYIKLQNDNLIKIP